MKGVKTDGQCGCLISKATAEDLDGIIRLEQESSANPYPPDIIRQMFEGDTIFFKAAQSGQIVGYAAVSIVFEDADIVNIVVGKEYRGGGIGKSLMDTAMQYCADNGARRILLEVDENNRPAISLYRKLGFLQISKREKYYGENTALIMLFARQDD